MPQIKPLRRSIGRLVPGAVRMMIRRLRGKSAATRVGGPGPPRVGPSQQGGIARLNVGCGPTSLMADWWNVDIRSFNGVDEVVDVTVAWPWRDLDYVYGEHFLEHLAPDQALAFLHEAHARLRPGGRIRLSTPGLEWVWQTHLRPEGSPEDVVADTYRANRAFHGWGHQFLFSRPYLEHILEAVGFSDIRFFAFGESDDPNLRDLEQHGTYQVVGGWPSVWTVEATRPANDVPDRSTEIADEMETEFLRHVRSGH